MILGLVKICRFLNYSFCKKKFVLARLIFAVFFIELSDTAWSQKQEVPIIEQDSITKLLKDQIPFDRKFVLKIKSEETPRFIDYMENRGSKSWNKTILEFTKPNLFGKSKTFEFDSIPSDHIQSKKENGSSYIYIEFKELEKGKTTEGHNNNFLKPSTRYTVIIPKLYTAGMDAFEYYFKGDSTKGDDVVTRTRDEQDQKFGLIYFVPDPTEARRFFRDSLIVEFNQKNLLLSAFQSGLSRTALLRGFEKREFILKSIQLLTSTTPLIRLPAGFIDTLSVLEGLTNLYSISNHHTCNYILEGRCSIIDTTTQNRKTGIVVSLGNLKESQNVLQAIQRYIETIKDRLHDASIDQGFLEIDDVRKQIEGQIDILVKQQDKIKDIESKILKKAYFLEPTIVGGSSEIFDFKTRSKFQITPDFGYIVYGFQKGFTYFTPYLGFNINFRIVDKNIPWKSYPNKTLWHRLSFMTGWTLASVEKKGQRENFFSKSSLLTGIGFKLSNVMKLNAGTLWFYQDDPNPLLDKRKIKSTFYFGASFDLDIKEFLNDFTGLIPNSK